MTTRRTNFLPLQGFEGLNYNDSFVKRQKNKLQLDIQSAKTLLNSFLLLQKIKGRSEVIKLYRLLSSEKYKNFPEAQTLLDCFLYPSVESLNYDGYINPIQAFENQSIWSQFLMKEYINNPNVIYHKITNRHMIRTQDLSLRTINQHKSALSTALNNVGIQRALCSFDVKVSYLHEKKEYVHNVVSHVFYDEDHQLNKNGYYKTPLINEFVADYPVIIKNVYNDIKLYADTLKPFCSRTIPLLLNTPEGYRVCARVKDPCLHLHYIFSELTFNDRILMFGHKLDFGGEGEPVVV